MAIINLGKIDKNLISILVGGVFCFFNRLLNQYKDTYLFKNVILSNICISIARFLAGAPYIIILIRAKKEVTTDDLEEQNSILPRFAAQYKKRNLLYNKEVLIFITTILNFIQSVLFVYTISIKTNAWICYIVITAIFYYLFFKIKLHKHHYLSAIIILLLGLLIDLVQKNLQTEIVSEPLNLFLRYFREILLSSHFVVIKYIMEKKFVSVYEYTFKNGLYSLILFGIFAVFDYFFIGFDNYEEYFSNFNYVETLVALGSISTTLFLTICILFTVQDSSPNHVFMIFVLGQFSYYTNIDKLDPVVMISLILILFFSFVFNEIIELNFCGLSGNTKRNIIYRAKSEDDSLFIRNESLNKEYEDDGYLIELPDHDPNRKSV